MREIKKKIENAQNIFNAMNDYIDYLKFFGNECAYTDRMLECARENINKLCEGVV